MAAQGTEFLPRTWETCFDFPFLALVSTHPSRLGASERSFLLSVSVCPTKNNAKAHSFTCQCARVAASPPGLALHFQWMLLLCGTAADLPLQSSPVTANQVSRKGRIRSYRDCYLLAFWIYFLSNN